METKHVFFGRLDNKRTKERRRKQRRRRKEKKEKKRRKKRKEKEKKKKKKKENERKRNCFNGRNCSLFGEMEIFESRACPWKV